MRSREPVGEPGNGQRQSKEGKGDNQNSHTVERERNRKEKNWWAQRGESKSAGAQGKIARQWSRHRGNKNQPRGRLRQPCASLGRKPGKRRKVSSKLAKNDDLSHQKREERSSVFVLQVVATNVHNAALKKGKKQAADKMTKPSGVLGAFAEATRANLWSLRTNGCATQTLEESKGEERMREGKTGSGERAQCVLRRGQRWPYPAFKENPSDDW